MVSGRGASLFSGVNMKPLKDSQFLADRDQVIAAFRREGLSEQQAKDATAAARFTQADDVEAAVPKFLRERPWFQPQQETASAVPDDWPTDASGRRLALHEMTDDELARLAGEKPEPTTTKLPTYSEAELEAMGDLDRLAIKAGAAPKVERDDSDIDEINAELEARAEHREETHQQQIESGAFPMFETKKASWGQS
jgi:hypothetical protein